MKKKETKLKIGEFSRLMQVTVKTLRHYESLGLLIPAEVDDSSGYRYYTISQMQRLNSILALKNLGFSLEEIGSLYDDDTHSPGVEALEEKCLECERQIESLGERLRRLKEMIHSRKNINKMEKFTIQSLPAIIVASHREVLSGYDAVGEMCVNVIGPEMHRLGCRCTPNGYCFTIEHDKEYRPDNVDVEYCEQVEEALTDSPIVQFKHMEAVPEAFCMQHRGPYNRFRESYAEAFRRIEEMGFRVAGHPRTVYVDGIWNEENPENWLSIIQIPIEKSK